MALSLRLTPPLLLLLLPLLLLLRCLMPPLCLTDPNGLPQQHLHPARTVQLQQLPYRLLQVLRVLRAARSGVGGFPLRRKEGEPAPLLPQGWRLPQPLQAARQCQLGLPVHRL